MHTNRAVAWAAILAVQVLTSVCRAEDTAPQNVVPAKLTRLSLADSLRYEQAIVREDTPDSSTTTSTTSSKGTVSIHAELALTNINTATFNPSTPFVAKIGSFQFVSTLGSDYRYKAGYTSARVIVSEASGSGSNRVVLATAQLSWNRDTLKVDIRATTPAGVNNSIKNIAAQDFVGNDSGTIQAQTTAYIQIGDHAGQATVPCQARVKRKDRGGDGVSYANVTVDIKGEMKP
jgi:stage V sporulation protein SpoVS